MGACVTQTTPARYARTIETKIVGSGQNHCDQLSWMFDENCNDFNIGFVSQGQNYCILGNHQTQIYYGCGNNCYGQLGIGQTSEMHIKFAKIIYFKQNGINIKKVFVNNCSSSTFWVTNDNKIYAHGSNKGCQLGITDNYPRIIYYYTPSLLEDFPNMNIIDIKSNDKGTIILCSINTDTLIMGYFREGSNIDFIPVDILKSMQAFYGNKNKIFASRVVGDNYKYGWSECVYHDEAETNINIIKIECNNDTFFYLNANGSIFGSRNIGSKPQSLFPPWEEKKFIDISCGSEVILTLTEDNCVHEQRQLRWWVPVKKFKLEQQKFVKIKAGNESCYAMTNKGKNYIWYNGEFDNVAEYHERSGVGRMSSAWNDLFDKHQIKDISLGEGYVFVMFQNAITVEIAIDHKVGFVSLLTDL